jgi:acyl carrier protein
MDGIEDRLRDILIEELFLELEKGKILTSYSLRDDLGLDSLGFVQLRSEVEQRFRIAISDDDFTPANFATISSLAELITRRSAA